MLRVPRPIFARLLLAASASILFGACQQAAPVSARPSTGLTGSFPPLGLRTPSPAPASSESAAPASVAPAPSQPASSAGGPLPAVDIAALTARFDAVDGFGCDEPSAFPNHQVLRCTGDDGRIHMDLEARAALDGRIWSVDATFLAQPDAEFDDDVARLSTGWIMSFLADRTDPALAWVLDHSSEIGAVERLDRFAVGIDVEAGSTPD